MIDFAYPEPVPAPVTTIAWRLAHVIVGVLGARVASHFGGPPVDYWTHHYAATAAGALQQLDEVYLAWREGVTALGDEPGSPDRAERRRGRSRHTPWQRSCSTSTARCCTTEPRSRCCATCTPTVEGPR